MLPPSPGEKNMLQSTEEKPPKCLNWYQNTLHYIHEDSDTLVVSFLLGKSPASVYYCMPTFRNSLSVPSSKAMVEHSVLPLP